MGKKSPLQIVLFAALLLGVAAAQFSLDVSTYVHPDRIRGWLESAGALAPVVYMLMMASAVVVSPIPSLPLNVAAGAFFGPLAGTAYSLAGALLGALASFSIARYLGRGFIERFLSGHVNLCSRCSDRILTKIVFLSRLIPVVSFDVVSYGAGLTMMSLRKFALATLLGMVPLTALYNYAGSVLVFGGATTVSVGLAMVALFFVLPWWLERKKMLTFLSHPHVSMEEVGSGKEE
jgi:uncharacterized membrane protein YdjX (TVP38/TMEM64 family)